jgi:hypothetical protein
MGTKIAERMWVRTLRTACGYEHCGGHVGTNIAEGMWVGTLRRACGYEHCGGHVGTNIAEDLTTSTFTLFREEKDEPKPKQRKI